MSKATIFKFQTTSEQPPDKKPKIEHDDEKYTEYTVEANLLKAIEKEENEEGWETQTELPHRCRRLPLEMNCEIFKFLNLEIQRKFIWGLGKGIYGMFRQKHLIKARRLYIIEGNGWISQRWGRLSEDHATRTRDRLNNVFAAKGFPLSGQICRKPDNFPGTIIYYYEVRLLLEPNHWGFRVGLSDGKDPPDGGPLDGRPNSFLFHVRGNRCRLAGRMHNFEWPEAVKKRPRWKSKRDVIGCGILLDQNDKVAIFFTLNGTLLGRKFPISPTVNHLFPTLQLFIVKKPESNFGDDPANPFFL